MKKLNFYNALARRNKYVMSWYLLWHIYSFSLIFLPWFFGLIHHRYSGTLWDTHTATSARPEVIFHMQRVRSVQ